ncbi:MAG: glycosyltransferase family 4 protein [Vicinamibacteria bacterium]|nr:glycosyltransferase family 4 protein [Vicinamibacteria bacterium]
MKPLLFIVPALPQPPTTGGEIFNQRLAHGLAAEWDLTVATFADLGGSAQMTAAEFERRLVAFVKGGVEPGPVLLDTYLYRQFDGALDRLRALGFGPFIGFGQAWYPGRYRSFLSRARVQARLMRLLRRLDHHVVVSESLESDYARLGIPPAMVDVVLPGFDLASSLPSAPSERSGPLRVRIAGTYMPAKGQHLLIEAIERLVAANPDLPAVMRIEAIGPKGQAPEYVRDLQARADRLPPGLVTLSGATTQPELWKAFSDTDVFCFPAAGEGLGMVVVEAMLCGAFPLVSPDGPLVEVVGKAGRVVPRDATSIAAALSELLADPALPSRRREAMERARAIAPAWSQSVERVGHSVSRALDRVMAGQDGPRVGLLGRLIPGWLPR